MPTQVAITGLSLTLTRPQGPSSPSSSEALLLLRSLCFVSPFSFRHRPDIVLVKKLHFYLTPDSDPNPNSNPCRCREMLSEIGTGSSTLTPAPTTDAHPGVVSLAQVSYPGLSPG